MRRSKADQEGRGAKKGIPYAVRPGLCAVRALAAGLDAATLGAHSLRAGFATTAARKGKSLDAIMRQTLHKSERVARSYVRHGGMFDDNAAAGLV